MECPKCGLQMIESRKNKGNGIVLWKCHNPDCGHIVLIQKDAQIFSKRQNFNRNRGRENVPKG